MTKIHEFLEKYISKFLVESRIKNPFIEERLNVPTPPPSEEVELLICYLQESGLDPVIIGTLAVIKHLKITDEDIRTRLFRPAPSLELFVKEIPSRILPGWKITDRAEGLCWISPSEGYVDFKMPIDFLSLFDKGLIEQDQESVEMGCPVASLKTIFQLKLQTDFTNDLSEVASLIRRTGIPNNLEENLRTPIQKKNFEMLKRWAKLRL